MVDLMGSEEVRIAEAHAREAKAKVEAAKVQLQIEKVRARGANASLRWKIFGVLGYFALIVGAIVIVNLTESGVFN